MRRRECLFRGGDGVVDIFFGVRRTQECGLELRWRQVHASVQHGAEEAGEGFGVAFGS